MKFQLTESTEKAGFWVKNGLFWAKNGQKTRFAVTDSLTWQKCKLFITCKLQGIN